jgi:GT2 family glycosyltransferase
LRTWPHGTARVVPWIRGAALAIRRAPFVQVGGFDTAFFMYFEETDLAYRLAAAGWEAHFSPAAQVYHVGGASTMQNRAQMTVQYYASMELFYRRHRKPWEHLALRAILRATKGLSLVRDRARMLFASTPEARERLRADVEAWRRIVTGGSRAE